MAREGGFPVDDEDVLETVARDDRFDLLGGPDVTFLAFVERLVDRSARCEGRGGARRAPQH